MTRILTFVLGFGITACAHAGPETERAGTPQQSSIGYPTVAAALADLTAQPDNEVSVQEGWTIISDRVSLTLWSFTPDGHPAHPAAVKRTTVERDGSIYIEMKALCQAQKTSCDELIEQFNALNGQIREHMQDQTGKERPNNSFKPNPLR